MSTRYVMVVRHPDYANEITTFDDDVKVFDYDLGSSFNGTPGSEEDAMDWMGEDGPTELDRVPADHPLFNAVIDLYAETVGDFPACMEVLKAYVKRRRA